MNYHLNLLVLLFSSERLCCDTNLPMISDIALPSTAKKNRKYPGQKIILTEMFWNENTAWKLGLMEPSLLFWICLSNLLWGGPRHWGIQQESAENICKKNVPNRWKDANVAECFYIFFFLQISSLPSPIFYKTTTSC